MAYYSDIQGDIPSGEIGNLFTLPKEYCPLSYVFAYAGPSLKIQIRINSDGIVNFYNYGDRIDGKNSSRFTLTYVTA